MCMCHVNNNPGELMCIVYHTILSSPASKQPELFPAGLISGLLVFPGFGISGIRPQPKKLTGCEIKALPQTGIAPRQSWLLNPDWEILSDAMMLKEPVKFPTPSTRMYNVDPGTSEFNCNVAAVVKPPQPRKELSLQPSMSGVSALHVPVNTSIWLSTMETIWVSIAIRPDAGTTGFLTILYSNSRDHSTQGCSGRGVCVWTIGCRQ